MEICFATNNKGKLKEIREILGDQYTILSLGDIGCNEDLPETQSTIEGNSRQKAAYVSKNYNVNCFADDTGLIIDALDGEPGVYSARYAGADCNPEDNINLVLNRLEGKSNRKARFLTCITLFLNGEVRQFEGEVEGEITTERQGGKGFGYDPIFRPEGYESTFAEMSSSEKNKISHRGRAVKKLASYLKTIA